MTFILWGLLIITINTAAILLIKYVIGRNNDKTRISKIIRRC